MAEEFALLLPDADLTGAIRVGACRANREQLALSHPRAACGHVTISIGFANTVPSEAGTFESLVTHADAALYEAERAGRNHVIPAAG